MKARAAVMGILAALTTMSWMPAAHAGGGSWEFEGIGLNDEAVLVQGRPVHAYSNLWMEGVREHGDKDVFWAGPGQGPFYGYIISGEAEGPYPPPLPANALYVGDVVFEETEDPRVMRASLDFVMPDLEPGEYDLIHCNDPCTRQIGDTMSTGITVVEDEGQAFITDRLNRTDRTLTYLELRSKNKVERLETVTARMASGIDSMQEEISSLESKLELASQPEPEPTTPVWIPLVIGAVTAAAGTAAVRSGLFRRSRQTVLES